MLLHTHTSSPDCDSAGATTRFAELWWLLTWWPKQAILQRLSHLGTEWTGPALWDTAAKHEASGSYQFGVRTACGSGSWAVHRGCVHMPWPGPGRTRAHCHPVAAG